MFTSQALPLQVKPERVTKCLHHKLCLYKCNLKESQNVYITSFASTSETWKSHKMFTSQALPLQVQPERVTKCLHHKLCLYKWNLKESQNVYITSFASTSETWKSHKMFTSQALPLQMEPERDTKCLQHIACCLKILEILSFDRNSFFTHVFLHNR